MEPRQAPRILGINLMSNSPRVRDATAALRGAPPIGSATSKFAEPPSASLRASQKKQQRVLERSRLRGPLHALSSNVASNASGHVSGNAPRPTDRAPAPRPTDRLVKTLPRAPPVRKAAGRPAPPAPAPHSTPPPAPVRPAARAEWVCAGALQGAFAPGCARGRAKKPLCNFCLRGLLCTKGPRGLLCKRAPEAALHVSSLGDGA
ncbi:hypothetical protein M885DRAFT_140010 [Pelagophyceae sp. CCMP2097]|nr:hypothetical protein M885DRAFT_140010 [Pelagophyceae sp. CCMP2097]